MLSFAAASAAASVELTSPGTTTRSGRSSMKSRSSSISALPVCSPCDAGADRELVVRLRQRQLLEEDVVDLAVVVLARVDEPLLDVAEPLERGVDRRDLHVVRPRADDVDHQLPHHNHASNCVRPGLRRRPAIGRSRGLGFRTARQVRLAGSGGTASNPGRKGVVGPLPAKPDPDGGAQVAHRRSRRAALAVLSRVSVWSACARSGELDAGRPLLPGAGARAPRHGPRRRRCGGRSPARSPRSSARSDPQKTGNPAWVRYNEPFYERRVAVPLAGAALYPLAGDRSLLYLSLAGYVAVDARRSSACCSCASGSRSLRR